MQTLAPDSFCPLTDPQPYQREQDQPPLARARGAAGCEGVVMEILGVRRPAIGCIAWLGVAIIWLRCPVKRLFVTVALCIELLRRKRRDCAF